MDGVYVGDGSGGGGGSSDGESVGNLVVIFIMDMEFLSDLWLEQGILWERHI